MVDQKTQAILATAFANGSQHDFELFKESRCFFSKHIRSLADSGYLGLGNLHANSQITCQEIETSSVDQRAEGEQPATFS